MPTAWLFEKAPVALFYYEAFTDCVLHHVNRDEFLQSIEKDPAVLSALLRRYATLYVSSTVQLNALEHSKSVDKILHMLHHLIMRFGTEQGNGLWRIDLRLTHQDFANMIGLTRETIATELARLKRKKVVSYFGQRYLVRMDDLQALLGEDNFSQLSL